MEKPSEKNLVQEMRDALQEQLSEFGTSKKRAQMVKDEGAKRWCELKESVMRLVEEVNQGLPEGILAYVKKAGENEFTLMQEVKQRTLDITFDPHSAQVHVR